MEDPNATAGSSIFFVFARQIRRVGIAEYYHKFLLFNSLENLIPNYRFLETVRKKAFNPMRNLRNVINNGVENRLIIKSN